MTDATSDLDAMRDLTTGEIDMVTGGLVVPIPEVVHGHNETYLVIHWVAISV